MGNNSNMIVNDSDYLDSSAPQKDLGARAEEQLNSYIQTVKDCLPGLPSDAYLALSLYIEGLNGSVIGNFNLLIPEQGNDSSNYVNEIEAADVMLYND